MNHPKPTPQRTAKMNPSKPTPQRTTKKPKPTTQRTAKMSPPKPTPQKNEPSQTYPTKNCKTKLTNLPHKDLQNELSTPIIFILAHHI